MKRIVFYTKYLISPGVLRVRLTRPPASFSGGFMVTDCREYDTGNLQSFMQFRSLPHVARLKLYDILEVTNHFLGHNYVL